MAEEETELVPYPHTLMIQQDRGMVLYRRDYAPGFPPLDRLMEEQERKLMACKKKKGKGK